MELPYKDLPEIPTDFYGKLKLLGEQLDIFLQTVKEGLEGPLKGGDSPEFQMLTGATRDLEELGPAMLQAFSEVREAHLEVARDSLKAAEELPQKIREMDEQLAKDLAPFAAENFIPKPAEPVPDFIDLLDIEQVMMKARSLLELGNPAPEGKSGPPQTSGNIWENWEPRPVPVAGTESKAKTPPDYVFPAGLLASLGLEVEPEKARKAGGNIWDKWG